MDKQHLRFCVECGSVLSKEDNVLCPECVCIVNNTLGLDRKPDVPLPICYKDKK